MSDAPAISCVIPTFERVGLVRECLASVLTQQDVSAEILISDDSRGGRVRDHVLGLDGIDRKLIYLDGARTGNPVDNWNHGLAIARSPLRVLIHQDEILSDPFYLRDAVARFSIPSLAAVIGRTVVRGGLRPSRHAMVAGVGRRLPAAPVFLTMFNWIGPTAAFVFRGEHLFDPTLVQLADVEFYRRVLKTGPFTVLPGPRVASRGYHGDQITATIDPVRAALEELESLANRTPPALGPLALSASKLATRARQWSR